MSDQADPPLGAALSTAAKAVLGAPGLWIGAALGQWLLAKAIAIPVQASVAAAIEGHAPGTRPESHERVLAVLAELFVDQPAIPMQASVLLIGAAIVSLVAWTLLSGGVIARFHYGKGEVERVGGTWLRTLPAVALQSLWHVGLRLGALFAALSIAGSMPGPLGLSVIGITLVVSVCALDLARAAVVTGESSPLHPRTAARAFMVALRTPQLLVPSAVLTLIAWGCALTTLLAAIWALQSSAWVWAARGLSAVALTAGLVRLAFTTAHPAVRRVGHTPPAGDETESST